MSETPGPPVGEGERTPEREGIRITPEVARSVISTANPRYLDLGRPVRGEERGRVKDALMGEDHADLRPQARMLARSIMKTSPEQRTTRKEAYLRLDVDRYIEDHLTDPNRDPQTTKALGLLSDKIQTESEGRERLTAEYIFDNYRFPEGESEGEIIGKIEERRRGFMDALVEGSRREDGTVNMQELKGMLEKLHPIIKSKGLLWSTMAEGILRQPPDAKGRMIDDVLAVQGLPPQANRGAFAEMERFSGLVEYQAVVKRPEGVASTTFSYVTPYGSYLADQGFFQMGGGVFDAKLDDVLDLSYKKDQATDLLRLTRLVDENITSQYILELEDRVKDIIADGKLQGFALIAEGVDELEDGLVSSLASIFVTDYIVNHIDQEDKHNLILEAYKDAHQKIKEIDAKKNFNKGTDVGKTALLTVLTDSEGQTIMTAGGSQLKGYLRDKVQKDVTLSTVEPTRSLIGSEDFSVGRIETFVGRIEPRDQLVLSNLSIEREGTGRDDHSVAEYLTHDGGVAVVYGPVEQYPQIRASDDGGPRPPDPEGGTDAEAVDIQHAEQQAWQETLGVQVDIAPLLSYVTPEVQRKFESLGMELRFIPSLDLSEASLRDKSVPEYLQELSERYPSWRSYDGSFSVRDAVDNTKVRNLKPWFWEQVKEGNVDFPVLPGQWMAVEMHPDLFLSRNGGTPSALTTAMDLTNRDNMTWDTIKGKLDQVKEFITTTAGVDSSSSDIRLLTAVEWNLLGNREGWGNGDDREWLEDKCRTENSDELGVGHLIGNDAWNSGVANVEFGGYPTFADAIGFRAALVLKEVDGAHDDTSPSGEAEGSEDRDYAVVADTARELGERHNAALRIIHRGLLEEGNAVSPNLSVPIVMGLHNQLLEIAQSDTPDERTNDEQTDPLVTLRSQLEESFNNFGWVNGQNIRVTTRGMDYLTSLNEAAPEDVSMEDARLAEAIKSYSKATGDTQRNRFAYQIRVLLGNVQLSDNTPAGIVLGERGEAVSTDSEHEILAATESRVRAVGITEQRGNLDIMQDAHTLDLQFGGSTLQSLFALYNGTGGSYGENSLTNYSKSRMNEAILSAFRDERNTTIEEALKESFIAIDREAPDAQRMGVDAAIIYIRGNQLYVSNVGPTTVMMERDGHAEQLTADHTLSNPEERSRVEQVRDGAIMEDDGYAYVYDTERRGGVFNTRALGNHDYPGVIAEPSVRSLPIQTSDKLIVASEMAFWRHFGENRQEAFDAIRDITDAKAASDRLVEMARERGSSQNLSIMVIDMKSGDQQGIDATVVATAERGEAEVSLVERLAQETREQGMGYLHGKFPARLNDGGRQEMEGSFQDIGGFSQGELVAAHDGYIRSLENTFGNAAFRLDQLPHDHDTLIVTSLGRQIRRIGPPSEFIERQDLDEDHKQWKRYTYFMPVDNRTDSRPNAFVALHVAVPPSLAVKIDGGISGDSHFIEEYARALYPNYFGDDPNEFIAKDPAVSSEVNIIRIGEEELGQEIVDRETKEKVAEILGSVIDRAVNGKWKNGATIPAVGDLPEITIPPSEVKAASGHKIDATDYKSYPSGSLTAPDAQTLGEFFAQLKDYLSIYYLQQNRLPDGFPGHFITRRSIPSHENDLVDYFFFDPTNVAGRTIGLIHKVYEMPRNSANNLFELIERNPDAAEEFDRQSGGNIGTGKILSSQIGIVDMNPLIELSRRAAASQGSIVMSNEFPIAVKSATTNKDYSQPYPSA